MISAYNTVDATVEPSGMMPGGLHFKDSPAPLPKDPTLRQRTMPRLVGTRRRRSLRRRRRYGSSKLKIEERRQAVKTMMMTTSLMRKQPAWIGVTWWTRTHCPRRDPSRSTRGEASPRGRWSQGCPRFRRELADPPSPSECRRRIDGWEEADLPPPPRC